MTKGLLQQLQPFRRMCAAVVLAGVTACGPGQESSVEPADIPYESEETRFDDVLARNTGRMQVEAQAPQLGPTAQLAADVSGVASSNYLSYTPALAMVIRTGTATIEVDSIDAAIARVRKAAQQAGGYLADLDMNAGAQQMRHATLQVKVPAERFEEVLTAMDPIGEVQALNISAQDVSEEFVDLRARAANDARLETRLIELLDKRTGDLADVLTVERELARVRQGIEQVEGRLRYLQERAHMSTLVIQMHEPGPLLTHAAGPNPIVVAVRQAWRNMIDVVATIIAFAGAALPFAVLGLLSLLLWKRYRPARAAH